MMFTSFAIAPLGDSALRVICGSIDDPATAERVAEVAWRVGQVWPEWMRDIVPAWTSVAVHYDAGLVGWATGQGGPYQVVRQWVEERLRGRGSSERDRQPGEVVLPVVYGGEWGPDLEEVAKGSGLSCDEVVARHVARTYRVRAVGFTPGFAYLEGLAPELAMPRRESPRMRVASGSVGIGGSQTGIYPIASPGGWNLVGRTPKLMFEVTRQPAPLVQVGDRVRFVPVDRAKWPDRAGEVTSHPTCGGEPIAEVEHGGLLTLVQDQGRWGYQHWGVSPGGAMGYVAARVANELVGNDPGAAVLECVLQGPRLHWLCAARVAVVGGIVEGVPMARPYDVAAGERVDLSKIVRSARCYLAVRGGIAASQVLGGRGTHLQLQCGGLGGRPLVAGAILHRGEERREPSPPSGHWFVEPGWLVPPHPSGGVRILRGPQADWFSGEAWHRLLTATYRVSVKSDRMGIRLEGEPLRMQEEREMSSEPVVTGAIQVPRGGEPIILGADRQTIGGYPVMACVASVEFDRLAQLRPGDKVRFVEISHAEAERLLLEQQRALAMLTEGLRHHD